MACVNESTYSSTAARSGVAAAAGEAPVVPVMALPAATVAAPTPSGCTAFRRLISERM
ncbi:hypothetical protein ACFVYP_38235 [Kitasatospora sp. NPDC058201]|uniref:hypothetical protein n=1 Tax=unclassified Kitasatospora TaxID=2633591 RepID=UPI00365BB53E